MYEAMTIFSLVDGFFDRLNQRFNLPETGWSRRLQLLNLLKMRTSYVCVKTAVLEQVSPT